LGLFDRRSAFAPLARTSLAVLLLVSSFVLAAPARAWNCVEYVREISNVQLAGNGWQWWSAALGRYDRGHAPERDAVFVFNRTRHMPAGHVAVVSKVLDPRTIEIDHANWIHRRISQNVRVQDVSPRNDWTLVRVWNQQAGVYGAPYPALGFVYAN
jgi:surface antigen